jgi:hypothetical protein
MPLNSPPVSGIDLEGSTLALWNEFLSGYFDGSTHSVGIIPGITFPKATLRYQESPLPQPLQDAVAISVVWVAPSCIKMYWADLTAPEIAASGISSPNPTQQRAEARCLWMFLVRSVTAGGDDNAQKQVQSASSKLYGLLLNSKSTEPLAEKGIHHIRPGTPRMAFPGDGAPGADLGFKLRVLSCTGTLRYPILSQ